MSETSVLRVLFGNRVRLNPENWVQISVGNKLFGHCTLAAQYQPRPNSLNRGPAGQNESHVHHAKMSY